MRTLTAAVAVVWLAASTAQGHFVFLVPQGHELQAVFSDSLEPDENVPIERIAGLKLYALDASGKSQAVEWTRQAHALTARIPSQARVVGGSCVYGVFQRGENPPALLVYHAKALLGEPAPGKAWDQLPLEIVPVAPRQFAFLHQGKPVASADVTALTPQGKRLRLKTDDQGQFSLDLSSPGLYGIYARQVEAKAGEHEGKKYQQVTHYATLVFRSTGTDKPAEAAPAAVADPEATRLLADARSARAVWQDFPGFVAEATVNWDGQCYTGTVRVDASGKVSIEGIPDKAVESWTRRVLGSVVAHRLPGTSGETPCAFADSQKQHPLGRLILVLNDELHSSYRIRDRQIMVVNRVTPEGRFSILMQDNYVTPEGKFLPRAFVVHHFDKQGKLSRSEANYHTWKRLADYDLPELTRIITSGPETSVREVHLSKHQLIPGTSR
jgi:uncharacterized GH25 family protein